MDCTKHCKIHGIRRALQTQSLQTDDLTSSDGDEYFGFEKKSSTTNASTEMQVLKYFDDNDKSIQSLKRHPIIFRMFLRYNTALPSSTLVERPAGLTFTAHRNRFSDKTVEHLILLLSNKNCF